MKVCPVCQYEEEDANEVSCAICGSDLESESSSAEEPVVAPEEGDYGMGEDEFGGEEEIPFEEPTVTEPEVDEANILLASFATA